MDSLKEFDNTKSIQDLALIELSKNARILQRQLKLMRGMPLRDIQQEQVKAIILTLEKEIRLLKL